MRDSGFSRNMFMSPDSPSSRQLCWYLSDWTISSDHLNSGDTDVTWWYIPEHWGESRTHNNDTHTVEQTLPLSFTLSVSQIRVRPSFVVFHCSGESRTNTLHTPASMLCYHKRYHRVTFYVTQDVFKKLEGMDVSNFVYPLPTSYISSRSQDRQCGTSHPCHTEIHVQTGRLPSNRCRHRQTRRAKFHNRYKSYSEKLTFWNIFLIWLTDNNIWCMGKILKSSYIC